MNLFHRRCGYSGCSVDAGRIRCQDCGKAFCDGHVGAVEFVGSRRGSSRVTGWTRFVCGACASQTSRRS